MKFEPGDAGPGLDRRFDRVCDPIDLLITPLASQGETMIDEKPEDPAEPKADPLIDYLTGRGPPPWKRRWKRKRTLGDQPDMFRKRYTSERATEPEAPASDPPTKPKETP